MSGALEGKTIAISISDSPDLSSLGFGPEHLTDAMLETAQLVINQGGLVAYGGDLRPGGFTEQLLEFADSVDRESGPVVQVYLAWPLYKNMIGVSPTPSPAPGGPSPAPEDLRGRERALRHHVVFNKLEELTGLPPAQSDKFLSPVGVDALEIWARNLTAMRARMARDCDARIIMGGQTKGWKGALPGIVEEALATLDAGKPLYVLGAFGGAAKVVFEALNGGPLPRELTDAFHTEGNPTYGRVVERLERDGATPLEHAAKRLHEAGLAGLGNGLTDAENRRLAAAIHLPELHALILKGLFDTLARA